MIDFLPAEHRWASGKRPRIGLLTYGSGGPVWASCVDAARQHDGNRLGIAGWWLEAKEDSHAQENIFCRRVSPAVVDGLFIWHSGLATYLGWAVPGL